MKVQLLSETIAPDEFIRDRAWAAQVKLDGVRCLIVHDANGLRCVSRQLRALKVTSDILSVASALPVDCVIDGELVGGRFIAFDVQLVGGRDVCSLPMVERFDMLALLPFERVRHAVGEDAKRQLLETVRRENGEGVVFKFLKEPYADGRTRAAVKFKFWPRETFSVADVDLGIGTVGLLHRGRNAGRCAFPFNGIWRASVIESRCGSPASTNRGSCVIRFFAEFAGNSIWCRLSAVRADSLGGPIHFAKAHEVREHVRLLIVTQAAR